MDVLEPGADRPSGLPGPVTVTRAATALLARVRAVEARVTRDVVERVGEHGGAIRDLDYRVKRPGSLARKMADDVQILNLEPEIVAGRVNDALRYTVVLDATQFSAGVTRILGDLALRGYRVDQAKLWNFFIPANRYKGFHAVLSTPQQPDAAPPVVFEIQFHTEQSLATKKATHGAYKVFRPSGWTRRAAW